jgi:CSLREA domain-containing protein
MFTGKLLRRNISIFLKAMLVLITLVGSVAFPGNAHAQFGLAITVTTSADNTVSNGLCSLREAIVNANKNSAYYPDCGRGFSADGIFFSNALGTATIALTSALPPVTDSAGLYIDGGADITVSGGGLYQVFIVSTGSLTLDRLTVTLGRNFYKGGGAFNSGTLTITNSTFLSNGAGKGGGVYNFGGNLTITNSSFRRNGAGNNVPGDNDGGGVYNFGGVLTVTDSNFSQNGAYSEGGGIYISSGTATITNSTFSLNGDQFIYGSGIYAASGTLTVTKSTFSSNNANSGGGIFIASGTNANIANSTFSGNTSHHGGGIVTLGVTTIKNSTFSGNGAAGGVGGALSNGGTLYLYNTILANSTSSPDCFSQFGAITGSNNIIELDTAAPNDCGTAALAVDPRLGTLTGSPAYFPLLSGSPALNAGDDAICASVPVNNTSQNGLTRPQGIHCEIGSYEVPGP